jgi:hypothetical protein
LGLEATWTDDGLAMTAATFDVEGSIAADPVAADFRPGGVPCAGANAHHIEEPENNRGQCAPVVQPKDENFSTQQQASLYLPSKMEHSSK